MDKFYHIGIDESHGAKMAILTGDPGRVESIASYFESPKFLMTKREYTSYVASLNGEQVLIISTGMGGPSTAIALEELYLSGIRTAIRVGTCGGMDTEVKAGELVIATAAIRMEGTSREYVPIEFPAVADITVTNALIQAADENAYTHHDGVVHCKDSFYGQHEPQRMPISYELEHKWEAWIKAGALASEMETAAFYIVSRFLGIKAGCVLKVIWNQEREKLGLSNISDLDMEKCIKTAVKALSKLIVQ